MTPLSPVVIPTIWSKPTETMSDNLAERGMYHLESILGSKITFLPEIISCLIIERSFVCGQMPRPGLIKPEMAPSSPRTEINIEEFHGTLAPPGL